MAPPVLTGWRASPAAGAITDFVERVCGENGFPVEQRVAVFGDGTLWCEKQMPIQIDFIDRRFAEMAKGAIGTKRLTDSRLVEAFAGRLWSR
jgi:hypothetical protein